MRGIIIVGGAVHISKSELARITTVLLEEAKRVVVVGCDKDDVTLEDAIKTTIKEYLNERVKNDGYIYHGTGKGQAMNIQNDGYMNKIDIEVRQRLELEKVETISYLPKNDYNNVQKNNSQCGWKSRPKHKR